MLGNYRKERLRASLPMRRVGRSWPPSQPASPRRRIWAALKLSFQILLILAILAGMGTLGYLVYDSPFLKVDKVTMIGNQHFKPEDISAISGLIGQNILTIDTGAIARAIEQVPLVKRVVVSRQFTAQELVVLIEERQPSAIWQVKGAKYLVDDEGVVFQQAASAANMTTITDMDGKSLELGTRIDPRVIQLALKLTEALPLEMGTSAKSFEYLRHGGLVVITEQGWRARFGDGDDFEFKMATWKAILEKTSQTKLKANHVDLRFGTRPFFR